MTKCERHELHGPPVLVTEDVLDYRKCIPLYVEHDDVVLEVGCAQGVTTGLIAEVAKQAVGVDKSKGQAQRAQTRNPKIAFFEVDAFDISAIIKLGFKFTIIFIDISGNRPVGDVVSLIEKYSTVFQPRLFVVKCYRMKRLMGMCRVFPEDLTDRPFSGREHAQLGVEKKLSSHPLDVKDQVEEAA
mmetsp:Transcript_39549/g.87985  ORF Transcript_39549/g.87985 Transcript_39549/m.87985 type:complete len:186 (-) Transcript_39549:569-1126(-)|eukprot:CAMPEP_0202889756 /NCGR_PEP_ID=MMETSP1392-20130828/338_1 /ASSEMBLY_ACC=CAM_ASM_000868 /TAXON_ID=225041 /ORGANISM="Chlamydomonas chlamydogama, Strain SAG 11-48b" /LENGTH=185 /DNA_ID=CAMNT_0049573157 /DNA_START=79 /DNA_END=636 /DNA_ORIENTATION=+